MTLNPFPGYPILYKEVILYVLLLFLMPEVTAQKEKQVTVIDLKTNQPVPFANVLFGQRQQGTMSDIHGRFKLSADTSMSVIRISCLGYKMQILKTELIQPIDTLFLEPTVIELSAVTVYPGKNPALAVMEKVYENRDRNNPDKTLNYSCIIYHKMAFFLDAPDSLETSNKSIQKMVDFNRRNHLFLIESVSDKQHMAPDKTHERMISGRVSGLKQPSLAILPAQIQPFSFYQENIRLLDIDFLNPISKQGLKHYLFLLEDTILNYRGDTLFYISFEPRKQASIKGMKGSFHIHSPSFAIKTVNAETIQEQNALSLAIKQNYEQTENLHWFPDQLESRLQISKTVTGQTFPFPLVGMGKSSVTAIRINPELDESTFSNIQFVDETAEGKAIPIEQFRYEPLSSKDSATYHVIDSLGRKMKLDAMINFQKNMIEGFIPMGYVKLDMKKIIGYNQFEGFRFGLGIWTSKKLSERISTGGYVTRSIKSKNNNYGGGLQVVIDKKRQAEWTLSVDKSLSEIGGFHFLDGYNPNSSERYKDFAINTMDPSQSVKTAVKTRLLQYFKTEFSYRYRQVDPRKSYTFVTQNQDVEKAFTDHEYALKLRWAHQETFMYSHFGLTSTGTSYPTVWVNLTHGNGTQDQSFSYRKIESQIEKSLRLSPVSRAVVRLTGAKIDGSYPASQLYSLLGTKTKNIGLETPFTFETMLPNEFAATRFAALWIRNTFATRQNKPGNFKPEITLSTAYGIGDANNYPQAVNTFNKGYYESGIYFGNLFRQLILKYGFSVHYRYGPHKLPHQADNWAFKLGVEVGL